MFNVATVHDTVELPADLLPTPTTAEDFNQKQSSNTTTSSNSNSSTNNVTTEDNTTQSNNAAAFYSREEYNTAVTSAVARKYLHRTLDGQGICVAVDPDEVAATSYNRIPYGQPAVWVDVRANLVMFMPKVDTILRAQIMTQSPAGIRLSLHFYDHIYVPAHYLQEGSHFSASRGVWSAPVTEDQWNDYRTGDEVLAVVRMVNFEAPPVQQALVQSYSKSNTGADNSRQAALAAAAKAATAKTCPNASPRMSIIASFGGLALGPMVWYFDPEQLGQDNGAAETAEETK